MLPFIPEVSVLDHTNNIFGNKFIRRPDLTTFDRLQIAYEALCAKIFGLWGTISALAKYHNISRTFIYDTLAVFEEIVEFVFIAVGIPVTRHPPHRSVREELPHTAPTSG